MSKPQASARRARLACLSAIVAAGLGGAEARAQATLESARRLELTGKYAEAAEHYQQLASAEPLASALGLARLDAAQGRRAAAADRLRAAAKEHASEAEPLSALARLEFDRGQWDAARAAAEAALKPEPANLAARLVEAELLEAAGELDNADAAYRSFVDDYNRRPPADPDALWAIGQAAAQFARWNRLSDQFRFLVNELYPDALQAEPRYWRAHLESGLLFAEKYNDAEAARQFTAALKINPEAAEVYAALAHLALQRHNIDGARQAVERALEIDPELLSAWHAKADLAMANFDVPQALEILAAALKLNSRSEETLARIASAYVVLDGSDADAADGRLAQLIAQVDEQNPHAGRFYYTLATRLEERRKFDAAERYFRQAIDRMPRMIGPQAGLGMMYMRLGREEEARRLLDAAFDSDPFNVRVKNTLEVLDVLDGYETHETEHFVIRYDPARDKLLAQYMGHELERVFPELCEQFGFTPPEKSLFEIFNKARNSNGHGWFSARMVGLPYVGTVGACAGKMVALASPNDMPNKYNWARVVKHEFIHVINLQQTNYNVPHWFTEALAVVNEGYPRSEAWNKLLLERVPAGKAFTLDTINLGFIRPESGDDWQLAYCQAELYAEHLREHYGPDAIAKLLAAFAHTQNTADAIQQALGVSQAEFDAGYQRQLRELVATLEVRSSPPEMKLADLERAVRADPQNAELLARLAYAQLARSEYPQARTAARQALKLDAGEQLAAYVVARLHLLVGDNDEAIAVMEAALDSQQPQENLLSLLAGLRLKAEQYDEAARLYRLAADRDPESPKWQKALARVYLLSKQDVPLAEALGKLAAIDADDFTVRKKLAQLAHSSGNMPEAARRARQALEIDVQDAEIHGILAGALAKTGELDEAIAEYQVALELSPDTLGWRFGLALALAQDQRPDEARRALAPLRTTSPDYPGLAELWESLTP